jgi:superfamily II DNA or RNA helicase
MLLDSIRAEAKPGIWANGVNLARAGAVAVQERSAKEIVLRVRAPGRAVPWTVVLYPEDDAWECDCPGKFDPCEHSVAAAIALQQGESRSEPLPAAEARWARVVYRFTRFDGGLRLQRAIARTGSAETPLEGSLQALLAKPAEAAQLQVEQHDLIADRLLERPTRLALAPEKLDALLQVLRPARTVLLDGRPVAVADEPVLPRAVVEDRGADVVVRLEKDPRVEEVVSPGVALAADALCRLGEVELSGPRLERLPSARAYPPEQLGELTSRVLPELARRLPVDVRSARLPKIDRTLKPRVVVELTRIDGGLSAFPTLVYGAPAAVRIDGGRMVYLRGAIPLRDEAAEQRAVQQLRDELDLVPGRRATVTGPEAARFADKLRRWRGALGGDAAGVVSPNLSLRPELKVSSESGPGGAPAVKVQIDFHVEGGAAGQAATADAAEVIRAWREGLGLVPLEGGGWAPLPRAWLDRHGERVASLLAARREDGRVENHAVPALLALCDALEHPPPPGLERLRPLLEGFQALPEVELPADLIATLRPYQREGVRWLAFLRGAGLGGILADDMGLGKTLQAICALGPEDAAEGRRISAPRDRGLGPEGAAESSRVNAPTDRGAGPGSLVVCPTSVLPNWEAELRRFRPRLAVCSYHGTGRALDPSADVTLTTYALLRLDAEALSAKPWRAVVLDEAQAIKNPDSQVARAAYSVKADFRLAMTGTPLENRLEDLWSLMHFANPGLLGGRRDFGERVAEPVASGRAEAAAGLRARIRPFVLRRLKRDVAADLPPRTDSVLRVALGERERAVYDAVFAATRAEVVALLDQGGSVLKALEALLRLRQAACHPALVPGQQAASSSKVELLMEELGEAAADGHKALVFSQWTSLLDLIEPALKGASLPFERLDGSTADRGGVTARFQAEDGPPVMLISLKAGGTGLNLTAADHVFLMDPWWNPAVEEQAADRAHRIGQERPVFVYRMIAQATVEERILALQDKKRALFDAALGDAAAGAAGITREDLLALFD